MSCALEPTGVRACTHAGGDSGAPGRASRASRRRAAAGDDAVGHRPVWLLLRAAVCGRVAPESRGVLGRHLREEDDDHRELRGACVGHRAPRVRLRCTRSSPRSMGAPPSSSSLGATSAASRSSATSVSGKSVTYAASASLLPGWVPQTTFRSQASSPMSASTHAPTSSGWRTAVPAPSRCGCSSRGRWTRASSPLRSARSAVPRVSGGCCLTPRWTGRGPNTSAA